MVHAFARGWRPDCQDGVLLTDTPSLRAALFASAHPMDRFLTEHDRDRNRPPRLYAATYGLLHTMAHHVIRTMSRLSGLDEGGLGEYLVPGPPRLRRLPLRYDNGPRRPLLPVAQFVGGLPARTLRPSEQPRLQRRIALRRAGRRMPGLRHDPRGCVCGGNRYLSRSLLTGEGRPAYMDVGSKAVLGYLQVGGPGARGGS